MPPTATPDYEATYTGDDLFADVYRAADDAAREELLALFDEPEVVSDDALDGAILAGLLGHEVLTDPMKDLHAADLGLTS